MDFLNASTPLGRLCLYGAAPFVAFVDTKKGRACRAWAERKKKKKKLNLAWHVCKVGGNSRRQSSCSTPHMVPVATLKKLYCMAASRNSGTNAQSAPNVVDRSAHQKGGGGVGSEGRCHRFAASHRRRLLCRWCNLNSENLACRVQPKARVGGCWQTHADGSFA